MSLDPSDPMDVALGLALRLRRQKLKLSQSDLGRAVGVTFQQVQKYERGTNRVSFSTLMGLCEALDCSVASVVADVERIVGGAKVSGLGETLTIPEAPAILEAFSDIGSAAMRRSVLDLVRGLAKAEEPTAEPSPLARSA